MMDQSFNSLRIQIPEASDWQCEMFGTGPTGMILRPRKGSEPNFFWRWMQYLCFGNRWVRRTDGDKSE